MQNTDVNIEKLARLKSLIAELGLNQSSLAVKVEMAKSSISQIMQGKQSPDGLFFRIKATVQNLNQEWWETGEGQMFKQDNLVEEPGFEYHPEGTSDQEEEDLRNTVARQRMELAKMAEDLLREKKLNNDLVEVLKKISDWKSEGE